MLIYKSRVNTAVTTKHFLHVTHLMELLLTSEAHHMLIYSQSHAYWPAFPDPVALVLGVITLTSASHLQLHLLLVCPWGMNAMLCRSEVCCYLIFSVSYGNINVSLFIVFTCSFIIALIGWWLLFLDQQVHPRNGRSSGTFLVLSMNGPLANLSHQH